MTDHISFSLFRISEQILSEILNPFLLMYRDKNFPTFLKTELFEKTQFFPFCYVRKYMAHNSSK